MNILKRNLWRLSLPARWMSDAQSIARSPLAPSLKRSFARANTQLSLRSLFGRNCQGVQCEVLNFRVKAYSLSTLAYLYQEIFVDMDYYFETQSSRPSIVDCGSNIGMSIMFFKTLYPDARIIGFEPAADSFALLKENIESNGLPGVAIHHAALGANEGNVEFFQDSQAGSLVASTNSQRVSNTRTLVKQVRLSKFIDREVDFMKLDVEGAEHAVFEDLVESGCIRKISQMVIEYHHHIEPKVDRFSEFLGRLEQSGFGYQIRAAYGPQKLAERFQDILIYAYRKN